MTRGWPILCAEYLAGRAMIHPATREEGETIVAADLHNQGRMLAK